MRWKTLLSILSFLILIVLVFNWLGVGGEKIIIKEAGETFSIELESNPSTGYDWQVDFDSKKISLESKKFKSNSSKMVGTPGLTKFIFQTLEKGNTDILFKYMRSWEKLPPVEEKIYKLIIK